MTQEEKAKAYDKAIERARKLYERGTITESLGHVFPELAESEDERICEQIISFIEEYGNPAHCEWQKDWIAWLEKQGEIFTKKDIDNAYIEGMALAKHELEKQGEQKSTHVLDIEIPFGAKDSELQEASYHIPEGFHAEIEGNRVVIKRGEQKPFDYENATIIQKDFAPKIEPKFHEGEWIVWKNKYYKVNYNGCGYELIDQNGLKTFLEYLPIDNNAHLWSIQDAKEGDVLYSSCCGELWIFEDEKKCHVGYNPNYNSGHIVIDKPIRIPTDVQPATKEQRDLLFAKIKEAGYE